MPKKQHLEWLNLDLDPAERLLSFRRWIRHLLYKNLTWSKNSDTAEKQVGHCEAMVRQTVRDLEKRGYLFDGEPLRKLIENQVNKIAGQQEKGAINSFFVYFKRIWKHYVDEHADNLGPDAKTMGYHIAAQYNQAIKGLKTIPQLEAQSHQESLN